jgi:flagellar biosynthetic protein FliR
MTDDATALLATLPDWAFGFVLVMARIGAAVALLPGLGESTPPVMLRVGISLGVAALLLPAIAPALPAVPEVGAKAELMVAAEVVTGLWLGWLARLLVLALPIAGQFIGYMLGIANVLQPDPILGAQATPIARVFAIAAPLALLVSGLYALPLAALAGSYRLIPAGTMMPVSDSVATAVAAVGTAFALAVRLASPFLMVAIVWNVGTGLLARLVPRLQVYFVVMPAQILGGILLLAVLTLAIFSAWETGVRAGFSLLPGL